MKSCSFESSSQESTGLDDFDLARSYMNSANFELNTLDKSSDDSTPERCSFASKMKIQGSCEMKKIGKLFLFYPRFFRASKSIAKGTFFAKVG